MGGSNIGGCRNPWTPELEKVESGPPELSPSPGAIRTSDGYPCLKDRTGTEQPSPPSAGQRQNRDLCVKRDERICADMARLEAVIW
jgi:hypothetical protein